MDTLVQEGGMRCAFLRIFLRIFCFFAPIFFIFHPFELKIIALFFLREGNFFYGAGKGTSINTSGRPTFRVEKIKKKPMQYSIVFARA